MTRIQPTAQGAIQASTHLVQPQPVIFVAKVSTCQTARVVQPRLALTVLQDTFKVSLLFFFLCCCDPSTQGCHKRACSRLACCKNFFYFFNFLTHSFFTFFLNFFSLSLVELDIASEFKCKLCEKGRQFVDTSTACSVCDGGQYQNRLDMPSVSCQACPMGKYLIDKVEPERHDDINKCLFCPAGKYFEDQFTLCSDCVGGLYQNENVWANATCKSCGFGQFTVQKEAVCLNCASGKFQELATATEYQCKFCVEGKQFVNTQSACDICLVGKFQNDSLLPAVFCKDCQVGRFLIDNQSDASNHDDESDCLFCLAGKSYVDRLTPCAECLVGRYQSENEAVSVTCSFCAAG